MAVRGLLVGIIVLISGHFYPVSGANTNVCKTFGSGVFKTFNETFFFLKSTCLVRLTSFSYAGVDCSVIVQRSENGLMNKVEILVNKVTTTIQNGKVTVEGNSISLPYEHTYQQIFSYGIYTMLRSKVLPFSVTWYSSPYGVSSLEIKLERSLLDGMTGMCGQKNSSDNMQQLISDNVNSGSCLTEDIKVTGNKFQIYTSGDFNIWFFFILKKKDLKTCFDMVSRCMDNRPNQKMLNKYQDLCNQNMFKTIHSEAKCSFFQEFARFCGTASEVWSRWRTLTSCTEPKCPTNMTYYEKDAAFPASCSNPQKQTDLLISTCLPPKDLVVNDRAKSFQLVRVSECPCVFGANTYAPGVRRVSKCQTCECVSGKWVCSPNICPPRCNIEGRFVTTFDGKEYSLPGKCTYIAAKGYNWFVAIDFSGDVSIAKAYLHVHQEKYTFSSYGVKLEDDEITDLSQTEHALVFWQSSMFVQVQTSFGMKMQVQVSPEIQIYLYLPPNQSTIGLCGTYNNNTEDDYTTSSGIIENSALPFAMSWKMGDCSSSDLPMCLNTDKEVFAEDKCSYLRNASSSFASCHSYVPVNLYYEACIERTCQCNGGLQDCLCVALGNYAKACARQGIVVGNWRKETGCTRTCGGNLRFSYDMNACNRTCRSLSGHDPTCEVHDDPVEGCGCLPGTHLNSPLECNPYALCQCHYQGGPPVLPGPVVLDGRQCMCENGRLRCSEACECSQGKICVHCAQTQVKTAQRTCDSVSKTFNINDDCTSGCYCPQGQYEDHNGNCVTLNNCTCEFSGKVYASGQTVETNCRTCNCRGGLWHCEGEPCPGVCEVFGNGQYQTFDSQWYRFDGHCKYTLVENTGSNKKFAIRVESVPCCDEALTCSRSISVELLNEVTLTLRDMNVAQRLEAEWRLRAQSVYSVHTVGLYIIISVPELGLTVIWDKHTGVKIELEAKWKGQVRGLCGNFDGKVTNDLLTSSSSVVFSALEFGNSWKMAVPPCSDVVQEVFPCERHSYCGAWAQRRCMVLHSDTFKDCHLKVDPVPYYQACVLESCSCEFEGKFLGFCTAVAAYAAVCATQNVCINWRTPDLCPVYCDYYNEEGQYSWHYEACGQIKTCGKNNIFTGKLEGCYPRCPKEMPYYDENTRKCSSLAMCTCSFNSTVVASGQKIRTHEECCECVGGQIICGFCSSTTSGMTTESTTSHLTTTMFTVTSYAKVKTTTTPQNQTPTAKSTTEYTKFTGTKIIRSPTPEITTTSKEPRITVVSTTAVTPTKTDTTTSISTTPSTPTTESTMSRTTSKWDTTVIRTTEITIPREEHKITTKYNLESTSSLTTKTVTPVITRTPETTTTTEESTPTTASTTTKTVTPVITRTPETTTSITTPKPDTIEVTTTEITTTPEEHTTEYDVESTNSPTTTTITPIVTSTTTEITTESTTLVTTSQPDTLIVTTTTEITTTPEEHTTEYDVESTTSPTTTTITPIVTSTTTEITTESTTLVTTSKPDTLIVTTTTEITTTPEEHTTEYDVESTTSPTTTTITPIVTSTTTEITTTPEEHTTEYDVESTTSPTTTTITPIVTSTTPEITTTTEESTTESTTLVTTSKPDTIIVTTTEITTTPEEHTTEYDVESTTSPTTTTITPIITSTTTEITTTTKESTTESTTLVTTSKPDTLTVTTTEITTTPEEHTTEYDVESATSPTTTTITPIVTSTTPEITTTTEESTTESTTLVTKTKPDTLIVTTTTEITTILEEHTTEYDVESTTSPTTTTITPIITSTTTEITTTTEEPTTESTTLLTTSKPDTLIVTTTEITTTPEEHTTEYDVESTTSPTTTTITPIITSTTTEITTTTEESTTSVTTSKPETLTVTTTIITSATPEITTTTKEPTPTPENIILQTTVISSTTTTEPSTEHSIVTENTTSVIPGTENVIIHTECKDVLKNKTWLSGDNWTEDCFHKTCRNSVIEMRPVVCPTEVIPDCPNDLLKRVKDEQGCCEVWQCDCKCMLYGDPHYVSFAGNEFDFMQNCTYMLVEEKTPNHYFSIAVDNFFCQPTWKPPGSCAKGIILKYHSDTVRLQVIDNGTVSATMNDWVVQPPYEENGIQFETSDYQITIYIKQIRSQISLSENKVVILLGMEHFKDNTQGQCGVCGGASCVRKNGKTEDENCCEKTAYEWIVEDPEKPYCSNAPTYFPCDSEVSTPKTYCEAPLCDLLLHEVFQQCTENIDLNILVKNCIFDYCVAEVDSSICSSLERLADHCKTKEMCVQWRELTNGICDVQCPEGMIFDECRKTPNYVCRDGVRVQGIEIDNNMKSGCFCPGNQSLAEDHKKICVTECTKCKGPLGESMPVGAVWESNCHICTCNNQTKTEECKPKPVASTPICSADYILTTDCCNNQICVQKTCEYNGSIYKVGDKWRDNSRPCVSLRCTTDGTEIEKRVCPEQSCSEELRVWDEDNCCYSCNTNCAVRMSKMTIMVDNCVQEVELPTCEGLCQSHSMSVRSGDVLQLEQDRRCCQEATYVMGELPLSCHGSAPTLYTYKNVTSCECQSET